MTLAVSHYGTNTGTRHFWNTANSWKPGPFAWVQCKAQTSSRLSRMQNTVNEQPRLQHSRAPRAPAEFLALPESRPVRRMDPESRLSFVGILTLHILRMIWPGRKKM